jgi:hypothetical protein
MIDDTTPDDVTPGRLSRPVTIRALLLALALTALVSIAAGVAVSSTLLERGQAGPQGEEGPAGPEGPTAESDRDVDPEQVHSAIEEDPTRVAEAIADELDFAPSSLESDLDDVRTTADEASTTAEAASSDLSELCGQLSLAEALSDVRQLLAAIPSDGLTGPTGPSRVDGFEISALSMPGEGRELPDVTSAQQ